MVWQARTASQHEDADLAARAWDLDALGQAYGAFVAGQEQLRPVDDESSFLATINLVHQWRRFPSVDPVLPRELRPSGWIGHRAAELFDRCRESWHDSAHRWFSTQDTKAQDVAA